MSDDQKQEFEDDFEDDLNGDEKPVTANQKNTDDLLKQLNEAQAKVEELTDAVLRAKADAQNAKNRAVKDIESAHKYGNEKFAKELLPVIDSLERCLEVEVAIENELAKSVHEGVDLTRQMFLQSLEKFNLEQINPLHEDFDPNLHEAIQRQAAEEGVKSGSVVQVLQRGYVLNGRLIRPALVIVAE